MSRVRSLTSWSMSRSPVTIVVSRPRASASTVSVPKGGAGQVEGHRDVIWPDVLEAAQDDAAEAEDGVDELAPRRGQGRKGEVSAVDEPVAVEQHQAFHGLASGVHEGVGWTHRSVYRRDALGHRDRCARSQSPGVPPVTVTALPGDGSHLDPRSHGP